MSDVRDAFQKTLDEKRWGNGESVSGSGSSKAATAELVPQLIKLIADHKIQSLVDAPCGDFNWIGPVAKTITTYHGFDIVPDVTDQAAARARAENIGHASFASRDIIEDNLPTADLYLVRDCIVHLSFAQGMAAIINTRGRTRWLLTTTFPDLGSNIDIQTGRWRPINLQLSPYNLEPPVELIVERPSMAPNAKWGRKCLGLWIGT